jgi:transcription elongation factor GreA
MGDYTPIKNLVERCREHMDKVAEKTVMLTYEGLKKYQDELQELKVNRRQEVAQKLKEARAQGDLSENAEYDAAKDEQRDIEARIEEIEKLLKNVEVVDEAEVDLNVISFGCKVKLYDAEYKEELEYKIVGSSEADSLKGKISNESPVGKALLGHKAGETVKIETQAGVVKYKILEIQRSN